MTATLGHAAPTSPDAALIAATDRLVRERMRETHTPGVTVAIVRQGRVVLLRGYGYADVARRTPVDPGRTLFRLGSITKIFTYTLAMQQVEAGRLDIDRDLNTYLGAGTFTPGITTRAVMAHRSGFEEATMYRLLQTDGTMPSAEEFVHRHVPAQVRPAGFATSYSNFAVSSLGLAIARIAGRPYPDLVRAQILAPLGMAHTALAEPRDPHRVQPFGVMDPALARDMSTGYSPVGGRAKAVSFELIYPAATPAGGMSSTATDMVHFMTAYLNDGATAEGRILKPGTVAKMFGQSYRDRPGAPDFAGGFTNGTIAGRNAYWHGGAMTGFMAMMALVPDLDLGIFIAANSDSWGTKPKLVRDIVAAAWPNTTPLPAEAVIAGSDYAGEYMTSRRSYTKLETLLALNDSVAHVAPGNAHMLQVTSPDGDDAWTAITPALFRRGDSEDRIFFQRDGDGRVARFYAPNGMRFFERIGWWQRPSTLYIALGLTAVAALAALVVARRGRGWRRIAAFAGAVLALLLPIAFVAARPAIQQGDIEHWPASTIVALVIASYGAVVAVAAMFAAASGGGGRAYRAVLGIAALVTAGAVWQLSLWGVFGPVFN